MIRPALALLILGHASIALAQPGAGGADRLRSIAGQVVSDADGTPIRGARISIASRGRGPGVVLSDDEGRFEGFVPADPVYVLTVTKPGFAPAQLSRRSPASADLQIRLVRGAVVSGRVVDPLGYPVVDANVTLHPIDRPDAVTTDFRTDTDDLGEFRIGSLPAGRYEVSVRFATSLGISAKTFKFALARDGAQLEGSFSFEPKRDGLKLLTYTSATRGLEVPAVAVELPAGEEVSVTLLAKASADAPGSPAVSRAASPRAGGAIRGRISGPDGRSVSGASVRAVQAGGGSQTAETDNEGRYELTGLAAGAYRLTARNEGFAAVEYGQSRASPQSGAITLRGNQQLDNIDVVLPRGGTVSGSVVDARGDPLEGIRVELWQASFTGGRRQVRPAGRMRARRTDDRGRYRLHGILPGTYYVVAVDDGEDGAIYSTYATHDASADRGATVDLDLPDARGLGVSGIVVLSDDSRSLEMAEGESRQAPRVYYPGRAALRDALPLRLDAGQDAGAIDVVFAPERGVRVHGVAVDASGQPMVGTVTLSVSEQSGAPLMPPMRVDTDASGVFEFSGVPPGDYVVQASATGGFVKTSPDGAVFVIERHDNTARAGGRGRPLPPAFGVEFVTVTSDGDLGPFSIATLTGSTIAGQIALEGDTAGVSPSSFLLKAYPADFDRSAVAGDSTATPDADGAFQLDGLFGPVRISSETLPAGWWLESVMIDGRDASREPVTFGTRDESRRDVRAVFSSRGAQVTGRVLDGAQPATDYSVIVFPTDRGLWFHGSALMKQARPGRDGSYTVSGLAPGDYWVVAVDTVSGDDARQWQDAEVLTGLVGGARRITLREDERATSELRLVRILR